MKNKYFTQLSLILSFSQTRKHKDSGRNGRRSAISSSKFFNYSLQAYPELFIFSISLQKYRLGKQSKEGAENYKDGIREFFL